MSLPGDLLLLRPWWLAVLVLTLVAGVVFARRSRGLAGWERAVDPALMAALSRLGRLVPGSARHAFLPIAVAGLVALALVGPAQRDSGAPTFRNLDGIVVAMDLSRSIAEGGSLDDAEAAAQLVLQRAGTRPVSLIVYAGEAYVATAFTTDPAALGSIVAVLDGETVPDPGSRSDRALALARRTLAEAQILRADVVLVTDGEGLGPAAFDEVAALRAEGAFVSAIHVAPSQRPGDMPPPDPAGLERLAAAGEGFFADATAPLAVADGIGRRRSDALAEGDYAVLHYTDYGRYLLVLALFPALALFRRSV
ncbi:MAG: VWA domain-containing protein [Aurantimonas coralicida]